jgi:hypothetical protein
MVCDMNYREAQGVQQRLMGVKQFSIRPGNAVAVMPGCDHKSFACQTSKVRCAIIDRRSLRAHVQ